MKRALFIVLGLALCGAEASTHKAIAYTQAEKDYCGPEARRLCSAGQIVEAALGNYGGIVACFKQHRSEISRACVDAIRKAHDGKKARRGK